MTFVNHFNTKADLLVERFRTIANGEITINLFNEFNHVTLDVIALIAFGMNNDSINQKDAQLCKIISETLEIIQETLFDPFYKVKFI